MTPADVHETIKFPPNRVQQGSVWCVCVRTRMCVCVSVRESQTEKKQDEKRRGGAETENETKERVRESSGLHTHTKHQLQGSSLFSWLLVTDSIFFHRCHDFETTNYFWNETPHLSVT